MAKLSIADVEHIATLSRLSLTAAEKEKFANQLSSVLEYVEQLSEIDTDSVEPTSQVSGISNIAAPDNIEQCELDYPQISQNAPEFRDGSFVVPGVFDAN